MPSILRTSASGGSTPPLPLRVLVALVVALVLGGPITAVAADPAPTPTHVDHVGDAGETGCRAFQDDAYCPSGRSLSTPPLHTSADVELPDLPTATADAPPEASKSLDQEPRAAPLRTRAPPRL